MPIFFQNSFSKKKEEFVPLLPREVKIYSCGVTVYDDCHVGHARSLAIFDVLKKYLEYIKQNGEVSFYSTALKPFDSYFEEEFYNLLRANLKRGYKIQNQVGSCGFKIDFVVSNTNTGKRLAIECDGPCHFKDEIDEAYGIHIESDEERQRVLEAAGWKFCRIKYADWIDENFKRNTVFETIVELLNN